jgi:ribosomal protein S18 acetylase RimI-like enzyme
MSYEVAQHPWGIYQWNKRTPQYGQATLGNLAPHDVPACVADMRCFSGVAAVMVLVDDRAMAVTLDDALVAAGCVRGPNESFLAHVGAVPDVRPVERVIVQSVTANELLEYAVTKIKAFAGREASPWPSQVRAEVALRAAELEGAGHFLLARIDGEPVAVIGWYDDQDRHIFQLATRVPFRKQGIARHLLCHVLNHADTQNCRSVIINADPDDTPIQLYRRLGFTDEIYWRRRYYLFPPQ